MGATGPLCESWLWLNSSGFSDKSITILLFRAHILGGICEDGYFLRRATARCEKCENVTEAHRRGIARLITLALIFALATLILIFRGAELKFFKAIYKRHERCTDSTIRRFGLIFVTMQSTCIRRPRASMFNPLHSFTRP